jgi:thiol-disulfide isomerase/thioredoxin
MAAVRAARAAGSPKLLLLIIAVLLPAFARAVQFPGVQVPFSWNFVPPTAAPGYEDGDLIEFHGFNCDHCEEMEPLMNRVEKELNVSSRKILLGRSSRALPLHLTLPYSRR